MNIKVFQLIIFLVLSPIMLLLFHILAQRLVLFFKINIQNQKLIIYCIFLFNLIMFFLSLIILRNDIRNWLDHFYILLTYNCFAYFYFHFFNMSETARRIKLLIGIKTLKIHTVKDIGKYYNYKKSLNIRMIRLEQLGQIQKIDNNRYILKSRLFYGIAYLIIIFRYILGFEKKII